jgi:hypothetical protein
MHKMPKTYFAIALATLLSSTACAADTPVQTVTTTQAAAPTAAPAATSTSPAPIAEKAMVDADPAIWVIKDADTTIYLFGTVHILKPGLSWFDEAISDAFAKSDELVTELPKVDEAKMGADMMAKGMDATGTKLRSRMTPEQVKSFEAAMSGMGLPAEAFDSMEPWMAALTLSILPLMQQGYDVNSGVEKVLELKAEARTTPMPRSGLETVEEQLAIFDTLPIADQTQYLASVIESLPKLSASIDTMVDRWSKGDVEGLAAAMNESVDGNEALMKSLLVDRNARWATWIKGRMEKPGTVFIAVGAGHLAGKDSVQDYLAKENLKSERIAY